MQMSSAADSVLPMSPTLTCRAGEGLLGSVMCRQTEHVGDGGSLYGIPQRRACGVGIHVRQRRPRDAGALV